MTDIDFVRDGKVGDKVYDPRFGNGTIEKLEETYTKPVCVSFDDIDRVDQYYRTGRWSSGHIFPILCWGHREPVDQGHPPKRFYYPLCMEAKATGIIVEFTGLQTGTLLKASKESDPVGTILDYWHEHTNTKYWTPCERPVWKPTKPTWCLVSNRLKRKRLIVRINPQGQYMDAQGHFWANAKPCDERSIPDWWPKEWA